MQGAQSQLLTCQQACRKLRVHNPYGALARHTHEGQGQVRGLVLPARPRVQGKEAGVACMRTANSGLALSNRLLSVLAYAQSVLMPGSSMTYLHLLSISACPLLLPGYRRLDCW